MTDLELLKMQVEALEKLVKIKDDTISALQTQLALKPATAIQYVYWYYPYQNVITSQWQYPQYPQYPHYGGAYAGGAGSAGVTLQGQSGIITLSSDGATLTGGGVCTNQGAIQTVGYMSLDGTFHSKGL